jgi:hypothetical protein
MRLLLLWRFVSSSTASPNGAGVLWPLGRDPNKQLQQRLGCSCGSAKQQVQRGGQESVARIINSRLAVLQYDHFDCRIDSTSTQSTGL